MKFFAALTLTLATLISLPSANAAIVTLVAEGNFVAEATDDFEPYPVDNSRNSAFGGGALLSSDSGTGVRTPGSWQVIDQTTLAFTNALPHDGNQFVVLLPSNSQFTITFTNILQPVMSFGGYFTDFAANGLTTFDLYDTSSVLLGSFQLDLKPSSGGGLEWAGFSSSVAIGHIDIKGNQIPFDSLQISSLQQINATPEPASLAIWGGVGLCGMLLCYRRRALPL